MKTNCTLLVIITAITFSINSSAQAPNTWAQKANFGGTGRYGAVGYSIGAKGYIGTGATTPYGVMNDFWEYDTTTNTWTQKANFGGTAREYAVGFSIGNYGYIGTGFDLNGDNQNDFWEYDPSANTWTQKANFGGTARSTAVGFSIGNYGYIGTGFDLNGDNQNDFWQYDPSSNTWTQKANLGGTARGYAVGFSIGDQGYIGTGSGGAGGKLNDFWEYDPSANTWTQKANFGGTARSTAVGFSIGTQGYIGTGFDGGQRNDFWEYNTTTNTWTQEANFGGTARQCAVGFSIGTQGYIGTGNDINGVHQNDFWEYNPSCNLPVPPTNTTPAANQTICTGNSTILDASGSGTLGWYSAPTGGSWLGSGTNFTTPILTTSTIYYVQDSNSCGASLIRTNITVTVNPLPIPSIIGPTLVDTGTVGNVYTTQVGMNNYFWIVSSGGTITAGGGTGNNTVTVTWTISGSQSVSVNYTNTNGCTSSSSTVYPVTVTQGLVQVSGYITYYNTANTPMNDVTVTLQGTSWSAVSNSSGYYQIDNVLQGTYNVIITTIKPTAGSINSGDAAQAQQWSNSEYNGHWPVIQLVRFLSGDVTGDNTIQPNDPSLILAYFVNSWTTWVGHGPNPRPDWTFWIPDTTTQNSSTDGLYPHITVVPFVNLNQNFYGMVTGDFNRSFIPGSAKSTNDYVRLDYGQTINPDVNGIAELPLYAELPMEVGAISLILNFPSDKLEIEDITINSSTNTPLKYNVIGDELRIGWNSMTPINIQAGDKLLTLTVKLMSTLSKDETLRFDLAANPLNELDDATAKPIDNTILSMNVIGSTLGISSPGEGNLLLANYPNPFEESTTLAYTLPKAGEVTLEIRNMLGTVVQTLVTNKLQAEGDYKFKLDNNLLESSVYMAILKLNSGGQLLTRNIKIVCTR